MNLKYNVCIHVKDYVETSLIKICQEMVLGVSLSLIFFMSQPRANTVFEERGVKITGIFFTPSPLKRQLDKNLIF